MHGLFEEGKLALASIMVLEFSANSQHMTVGNNTYNRCFSASGEVFRSETASFFNLYLFLAGFFFFSAQNGASIQRSGSYG